MGRIPGVVTAQGRRARHHLHCSTSGQISSLFISLIKSLNLNFAELLKYFTAHHGPPNLKPKSFTCQLAARTALQAGAGAAGEQTADHGGGKSGEADQPGPATLALAAESPSKQLHPGA